VWFAASGWVFWARRIDREAECERILSVTEATYERVAVALDKQFRVIHNRAQVLLAICGVLLSTSVILLTGKLISAAHRMNPVVVNLLIGGGVMEIAATGVVVGGVMNVRWSTQLEGQTLRDWVLTSLRYRDTKTFAYRIAILFVLIAMALYQGAVVIGWMHGSIVPTTT
jgi:hypothetical protein